MPDRAGLLRICSAATPIVFLNRQAREEEEKTSVQENEIQLSNVVLPNESLRSGRNARQKVASNQRALLRQGLLRQWPRLLVQILQQNEVVRRKRSGWIVQTVSIAGSAKSESPGKVRADGQAPFDAERPRKVPPFEERQRKRAGWDERQVAQGT